MRSQKSYSSGLIFAIVCLSLSLVSGCTDIRKTMGIESKPSDEFVVSPSQKKLEIPPNFELLPPQSGQEGVAPAEPSKGEEVQDLKPLTASEKNLMKQLGAGLDLPGRTQMDEEATKEASKKEGFLGLGTSKKSAKGDVINPETEQTRLQNLKSSQE